MAGGKKRLGDTLYWRHPLALSFVAQHGLLEGVQYSSPSGEHGRVLLGFSVVTSTIRVATSR